MKNEIILFLLLPTFGFLYKKKLSEEKKILQWKEDTRMPRELLNIG
jgi:hypothetical protein